MNTLPGTHGVNYIFLEEYVKSTVKIKVKHIPCGTISYKTPNKIRRWGCKVCLDMSLRKTNKAFVKEIFDLVGDEYVFLDKYTRAKDKIRIKHNICGYEYKIAPDTFLSVKTRCPNCNESKGEKRINDFLIESNIEFEKQYRIEKCRNIKPLPFDFRTIKKDILIEYDGIQHYISKPYYGGEEGLKQRQMLDQIKNQYCETNNIKLIRIPYWDYDNIETILEKELL